MPSIWRRSLRARCLSKTGIYGGDPNWGGIFVALGYSLIGTEMAGKGIISPAQTSVSLSPASGGELLKFIKKGSRLASMKHWSERLWL